MFGHPALEGMLSTDTPMNSSSGEYLYRSVRDNKYALVVIDLPGVHFGNSRRDRVRYSAVSQL
eukprot:8033936-Lingulodinium_polyedra.AAC.1